MIKQKAVIYVVPNGFYYFQDQFTTVLSVGFPKEVFSDLEIKDPEKFSLLIETFIASYKLTPCSFILLLSPWFIFEKEISGAAPSVSQKQQNSSELTDKSFTDNTQHFLSLVPFDNVSSKIFPTANGARVVATNDDIAKYFAQTFSKNGSEIAATVPYFALSGLSKETNGFPLEYALSSIGEFESLKQFNIAAHPIIKEKTTAVIHKEEEEVKTPGKKSNRRLFVLIGVFVVLIGILIFVYVTIGIAPSQQPPNPVGQSTAAVVQPPVSSAPVASSSAISFSHLSVQLYGQEDQGAQLASISALIKNIGISSISQTIATVSPAKTTILFGKSISAEEQGAFMQKLSEMLSDVIVTQTDTQDSVIRIVLGK